MLSDEAEGHLLDAAAALGQMNSGKVSLDDSLKLYEEADQLIVSCNKKLTEAEQKIEVLLKNRTGDVVLENDKPVLQEFQRTTS